MTNPTISQSQKRFKDSVGSLFTDEASQAGEAVEVVVLKSSSDIGVIRNGGRNGAKYAPQSFLSAFKKLNKQKNWESKKFLELEVANENEERSDFHVAQEKQSKRIGNSLRAHPNAFFLHLGGGHDHVFPLLRAVAQESKKIIVINIDAHADTRTDPEGHSGTPFRQFADTFEGEFSLFQIGLHAFSNAEGTLSPLKKGHTEILWKKNISPENLMAFFDKIKNKVDKETKVIFSLDADALAGAEIPAVSAVNGHGISRAELTRLWAHYKSLPLQHPPLLGIYELNPVYDTLSLLSMRTLGTFFYECLE